MRRKLSLGKQHSCTVPLDAPLDAPLARARPSHKRVLQPLTILAVLLASASLVACQVVPSASAPAKSPQPGVTLTAYSPQRVSIGAWQRIALPAPPSSVRGFIVSPTNPSVLFACTGAPPLPDETLGRSPLTLWRTITAGATWTRSARSLGEGILCSFSAAPDDPARFLVLAVDSNPAAHPCFAAPLYLTNDTGATWRKLPPRALAAAPTADGADICWPFVTRGQVLMVYDFIPGWGSSTPSMIPATTLLARSDDDGVTWARIGPVLSVGASYWRLASSPDGQLALTVAGRSITNPKLSALSVWLSPDAGRTWRLAGTLPAATQVSLVSSTAARYAGWPSPTRPLYALLHSQQALDSAFVHIFASGDGGAWTPVPPLPVAGIDAVRTGIMQGLTALPDGRLLVWGPDPQVGLSSLNPRNEPLPAVWLWLWDPVAHQWRVLDPPLAVPEFEGCLECWLPSLSAAADGALYLYVADLNPVPPYWQGAERAKPGLFRVRLPADV